MTLLRILQRQGESDTILTLCLQLVVPHDYVILYFVNKSEASDSHVLNSKGLLIAVFCHTDYRIPGAWLN